MEGPDSESVSNESGPASPASTPPTSLSGAPSDVNDAAKDEAPEPPKTEQRRSVRSRSSVASYNVQVLAGTAIHTPTKYLRAISGNTLVNEPNDSKEQLLDTALNNGWTLDSLPGFSTQKEAPINPAQPSCRKSTRLELVKDIASKSVAKVVGSGIDAIQSLTSERGQNLKARAAANYKDVQRSPSKRARADSANMAASKEPTPELVKKRAPPKRKFLDAGLYVGQKAPTDSEFGDKKSKSKKVKAAETAKPRKGEHWFPLPMFHGAKLINAGRDFKLPRSILNPLPKKANPEFAKQNQNRAIDDAREVYRDLCRSTNEVSECGCQDTCEPDSCLNAVMSYECDKTNCTVGAEKCNNRPFADLKARLERSNMYDVGVEVVETADRGFGVRAMRSFEPLQIIMEYTGEIIDQWECDRRMNEEYKDNECYYLMTFDHKLIIDATKGSMARFVNHSCEPNCEMKLWKVQGKPRMALFAKDNHIDAGEELTYDYNFEAFNQSWSQQCRCGSANCRGVLGPRPQKERKTKAVEVVKSTVKSIKSLKRKAQDFVEENLTTAKRQKVIKTARSVFSKSKASAALAPAILEPTSPKLLQHESREERAARRANPRKALSRASKSSLRTVVNKRTIIQKRTVLAKKTLPTISAATKASARRKLSAQSKTPSPRKGSESRRAIAKSPSKARTKKTSAEEQIDADIREMGLAPLNAKSAPFGQTEPESEEDWEAVTIASNDDDEMNMEVEDQILTEMAARGKKNNVAKKARGSVTGKAVAVKEKTKAAYNRMRGGRQGKGSKKAKA